MCGAIRYEISEPPLSVYACHCPDCQRATGSAFSVGVVVNAAAFRATGKDPRSVPGGVAASGRVKSRSVCPDCGVWLFGNPRPATDHPGMVRVVRAGTLDDTAWVRPTTHYWTQNAQPWLVLDGTRHQTQPDIAAAAHRAASSRIP